MRTVITRRSRVIADTDAYANAKELVESIKEGATVTQDGDVLTLHSVTPQGHELIGEFVVHHQDGRISVRAIRDTLTATPREEVNTMRDRMQETLTALQNFTSFTATVLAELSAALEELNEALSNVLAQLDNDEEG